MRRRAALSPARHGTIRPGSREEARNRPVSVRKPVCQLSGEDGNAYAVIGRVAKALKRDGQPERAAEWSRKAMASDSYDALLRLAFDYVEVL